MTETVIIELIHSLRDVALKAIECALPVSYTHLDVYKRQINGFYDVSPCTYGPEDWRD